MSYYQLEYGYIARLCEPINHSLFEQTNHDRRFAINDEGTLIRYALDQQFDSSPNIMLIAYRKPKIDFPLPVKQPIVFYINNWYNAVDCNLDTMTLEQFNNRRFAANKKE